MSHYRTDSGALLEYRIRYAVTEDPAVVAVMEWIKAEAVRTGYANLYRMVQFTSEEAAAQLGMDVKRFNACQYLLGHAGFHYFGRLGWVSGRTLHGNGWSATLGPGRSWSEEGPLPEVT